MKDLIAYCGLDCEKCDAYLATIHDDQELREKTAKLWAQLNQAPILPENGILRQPLRDSPVRFEKRRAHLRPMSGTGNLRDGWGDIRE